MPLQQRINPKACTFPQGKKRLHSDSVVLRQKRLRSIIVLLESGLTPEQEEMALQIAYSRFSPEEIAAIEEALGR